MLMSEQSSWSRKYQWETERVLKHYQKDGVFKGPVHLNYTQKKAFHDRLKFISIFTSDFVHHGK